MLGYVIDAAREATGRAALVVVSPATERDPGASSARPPTSRSRTSRAAPPTRSAPALDALPEDVTEIVVLSGDVPLMTARDGRRPRRRSPARASGRGRPGHRGRRATRPASAAWSATRRRVVRGSSRSRDATTDAAGHRGDQRRAVCVRRAPGCGAGCRTSSRHRSPASSTCRARRARRARTARRVVAHRVDGRRHARGHQRPRPAGGRGGRPCADASSSAIMLAGVTIVDPASDLRRRDRRARRGRDPRAQRRRCAGRTRIGRGHASSAPARQLVDCDGRRALRRSGPACSSRRSSRTTCASGPFAHLRPGARIGAGAELGNFAEARRTRIGAGSKQHHFSYLGDAEVGEDVNIGAGTITANYDGRRKHRTIIGDGAFIGSDTILRAPVTIGEGAVHRRRLGGHPATCRRASWPSACRRASASAARDPTIRRCADGQPSCEILIIAILILLNGLFVAAEFALVTRPPDAHRAARSTRAAAAPGGSSRLVGAARPLPGRRSRSASRSSASWPRPSPAPASSTT